MKKILNLCLSILIIGISTTVDAAEKIVDTLTIGVIAPLTLGNAKFGEDIKDSVEIVANKFNASLTSKHKYKIIFEDGKCGSGNAAITAANKLINIDKVDALVIGCSGEILQISDVIEKNKIPTMVVFASHPKVKHLGPHIYRVFMDLDNDIPKIAKRIKDDGRKNIAIITEELPFTMGIKTVLENELSDIISASPDYSEGSNDFRSILVKVKGSNPDALFLNAASVETLGPLVRQISELKLNLPLYSFAYPSVPTFIQNYSHFADGIIFVSPPDIVKNDAAIEFKNQFLKQKGSGPNVPFVAASAYDGANALLYALENSAKGEPSKILDFLNSYNSEGVLGNIRFDENGDAIGINYVLKTIIDGKMTPLK